MTLAVATETLNFWLAVAGIALALVSLGWQIVTWLRSGPKVKVTIGNFRTVSPDGTTPVVQITARNVGRSAIDITMWGMRLPDLKNGKNESILVLPPMGDPFFGPPVPYRLEAHSSVEWRMGVEGIQAAFEKDGNSPDTRIQGWVTLATGGAVKSKNKVRLPT